MSNIRANITFIKKQSSKPYYDSSAITGLVPKLYFEIENKNVPIFNARKAKGSTFEGCGYELCNFNSKFNKNYLLENWNFFLAFF